LYDLAGVGHQMAAEYEVDVRDLDGLNTAFVKHRPEIVLHLAAQPLVRQSLAQPRHTYDVNVMGTVNVLETVRLVGKDVRAIVVVTSDKCYDNQRDVSPGRPFVEDDPMGGQDPYSSSKGCAELVTSAYRRSFFCEPDSPRVATARAGNVIGGGDWGKDRLISDIVRGGQTGQSIAVRNPDAVRPWQHVLNPLCGYLMLAQALWDCPDVSEPWNFGPSVKDMQPVSWIVDYLKARWPVPLSWKLDRAPHPREARFLTLDSSKAHQRLGWRPAWDLAQALSMVIAWHQAHEEAADMRRVSIDQIENFMQHQLPYRSVGRLSPDPAAWVEHTDSTPEDRLA
jgi:CDP-glucose 4,6-dehydratase